MVVHPVKRDYIINTSFFVFRHPVNALIGIAIYIGISLLMTGILQTGASIASRDTIPNWGWGLAGGLIDILFGFVLLSNPALTAASLPFVVGFWIIVSGIMSFADAFQSKKEGNTLWGLGMLGGVLSVFIGYFIMSNILVGALSYHNLDGDWICYCGHCEHRHRIQTRNHFKQHYQPFKTIHDY